MPKGRSSGKQSRRSSGGITLEGVSIHPSLGGVISDRDVRKGQIIGTAFLQKNTTGIPDLDYDQTTLAQHIHHSKKGNVRLIKTDEGQYSFETTKYIRKGQKIQTDYDELQEILGIQRDRGGIALQNRSIDVYNLEKFESGENPQLYITGYSGSGKSTASQYFSQKYNIPSISVDELFEKEMKQRYPDADLSQHEVWQNIPNNIQSEVHDSIMERLKRMRKRGVIEGINIPALDTQNTSDTIAIMNKGNFSSSMAATERDQDSLKGFLQRVRMNQQFTRKQQRLLKAFQSEHLLPQTLEIPDTRNIPLTLSNLTQVERSFQKGMNIYPEENNRSHVKFRGQKLLTFPADEHVLYKNELRTPGETSTLRIMSEKGKYKVGRIYETEWGQKVKVTGTQTFDTLEQLYKTHPHYKKGLSQLSMSERLQELQQYSDDGIERLTLEQYE